MFHSKKLRIFGTLIVVLGICIACGGYIYWDLNEWASYDPKDAAKARVEQTISAAYESSATSSYQEKVPSCGGLWLTEQCWDVLQNEVKLSSNQYNMKVVYYNWESDLGPWRGGDEITVEVAFANGNLVYVYTYESCIDYCSLE